MTPNQITTTLIVQRDDQDIEVEITGYAEPLVHGVFSGPPERCYPDEGGFAELEEAMVNGNHFELTQEEIAQAETLLYETYEDDMRGAAEMAAEAAFDDVDDLYYDEYYMELDD
jgi:hypothetical protein